MGVTGGVLGASRDFRYSGQKGYMGHQGVLGLLWGVGGCFGV